MQVEPAFNTRRGEHQGPTQEESAEFVEAFMAAFEIANEAKRGLTYSGARPWLVTQSFCGAPYGALIVNPANQLVSCYEVTDTDHPLTDMSVIGRVVGRRVTVDESTRQALLTCLSEKHANCQGCFCYWHCAGDCYVRCFSDIASVSSISSPRCFMSREITKRLLLWYIMAGVGVWRGQGTPAQEAQLMRTF
jgi:uncharacterized protein